MEHHIPYYMQRQLVRSDIFRDAPQRELVLVLTNCPTSLHIVRDQNVLSTCDLSGSVLNGHVKFADEITLRIHFSYIDTRKFTHFLLRIGPRLIIVNQSSEWGLMLAKEFENISEMQSLDDCDHPGQILVRLKSLDGQVADISLVELHQDRSSAGFGADASTTSSSSAMGPLYQSVSEQVAKAKTELATIRLQNERKFHEVSESMRFGRRGIRGDTIEEKLMVAKYGDIWQRVQNDRLVFGVPLFNNTFKR